MYLLSQLLAEIEQWLSCFTVVCLKNDKLHFLCFFFVIVLRYCIINTEM